jgi:hypothetical protein
VPAGYCHEWPLSAGGADERRGWLRRGAGSEPEGWPVAGRWAQLRQQPTHCNVLAATYYWGMVTLGSAGVQEYMDAGVTKAADHGGCATLFKLKRTNWPMALNLPWHPKQLFCGGDQLLCGCCLEPWN